MSEIAADPEHRDYLLACQEWQTYISRQTGTAERQTVVAAARQDLKGQDFHGTRKVIVGGETAFYIPDGSSAIEEALWPFMQFKEITTRGWLGRLQYVDMGKGGFLSWPIYDPKVAGPAQEDFIEISSAPDEIDENDFATHHLPLDVPTKRTLHFPVSMINYALCWDQ